MDYSAVSQAAKRFEQKTEVDHEIEEVMQRVITALKEVWMSNVETWPLYFTKSDITFIEARKILGESERTLSRYIKKGLINPDKVKTEKGA